MIACESDNVNKSVICIHVHFGSDQHYVKHIYGTS